MEFADVVKSPWVQVKLVGNREHEDYLMGAIDRRAYIKKMNDITRQYATVHLGLENVEGSSVYCKLSLTVHPEHGVGFETVIIPKDTATYRASMNPHNVFLPADYAFMSNRERELKDKSVSK